MFREMDAVFKALADESRRKLLDQLHKSNGQTLGELCAHLDMTRQAVTKHLLLAGGGESGRPSSGAGARNCITSIQCRSTRSPSAGSANTNAIASRRSAI